MHILITRSRDDAEPLARLLDGLGISSLTGPLLEIVFLSGPQIDLDGVQALLMTSANGVRAYARRSDNRALPLFAVGNATAREATVLGFTEIHSAAGDVDALAERVTAIVDPDGGALLHAAGSKVAGDLAGVLTVAGYEYRRDVLYEAKKATTLGTETIAALKSGSLDGVLFYSPRTAEAFSGLVKQAGLEEMTSSLTAFCLSPAVGERASELVWKKIEIAPLPEQESLINLLRRGK